MTKKSKDVNTKVYTLQLTEEQFKIIDELVCRESKLHDLDHVSSREIEELEMKLMTTLPDELCAKR